jgi:hypothetical protein
MGEMSCKSKQTLVEAAICTLIKEIIAAFEARRRARREAAQSDAATAHPATTEAMA